MSLSTSVFPNAMPFSLLSDSLFVCMIIDVFTERGYSISHEEISEYIPDVIDVKTGKIQCRTGKIHLFKVRCPRN